MKIRLTAVVLGLLVALGCAKIPSSQSFRVAHFDFRVADANESIQGAEVSSAFFAEAKAAPLFGRVFAPDEGQGGRSRVAMLAYSLWQRRLGGDPHILGGVVQLNGQDFQVVGIMPSSFVFPPGAEVWIPKAD